MGAGLLPLLGVAVPAGTASAQDSGTATPARHGIRLVKSYRAGSGSGSTDEGAKGKGWPPAGTYRVLGHQTDRDTRIKGYAISLEDKVCHGAAPGR